MQPEFPLKKVHIIGIGGIGMSAIAEILLTFGVTVQGSDIQASANTERLEKKGVKIFIGHKKENVQGVEAIIVSTAIDRQNPEIIEAHEKGIPVGHRSEILAEILRYRQGICISGSHGKTTTSSLTAHILKKGGLCPSFLIGGILNSCQSNAQNDTGKYMVVEADESDNSFLKLPTTISLVSNIDPEHIQYFHKSFANLKRSFETFVKNTAFYGYSVLCTDHKEVKKLFNKYKNERNLVSYGLENLAQVQAKNIRLFPDKSIFDIQIKLPKQKRVLKNVEISLIGKHNVQNAVGALTIGLLLGIKDETLIHALADFQGVQRRLTKRGEINNVLFLDDYAHHPNEIKASLAALKAVSKGKVIAVFQPHRYSRMQDAWNDFMTCFSDADKVLVADIFAAGEKLIPEYTQDKLVAGIQKNHSNVYKLEKFEDLPNWIMKLTQPQDVVVCLGAGSVSSEFKKTVALLDGKKW